MTNTKIRKLWLWLLCLSLPILIPDCVSLQNIVVHDETLCSPAGEISGGALCSHLLNKETAVLSFAETLDFLNAQPVNRDCVVVPGFPVCADDQALGAPEILPARAAAIMMTAKDWGQMASDLDAACRDLGKYCTFSSVVAQMRAAAMRVH